MSSVVLRRFANFRCTPEELICNTGVPSEISSDNGPEFKAYETKCFLERWGVRHRTSSS